MKTLYQTCPNEKIMNAETCLAHVPNTDTFSSFISIIDKMSNKIGSDKSLIAVRIGSIRGDLHPQRSRFGKGYKNDINTVTLLHLFFFFSLNNIILINLCILY